MKKDRTVPEKTIEVTADYLDISLTDINELVNQAAVPVINAMLQSIVDHGQWSIESDGCFVWDACGRDAPYWYDEFPINIRISPASAMQAVQRDADYALSLQVNEFTSERDVGDEGDWWLSKTERAVAAWKAVIAQAEAEIVRARGRFNVRFPAQSREELP